MRGQTRSFRSLTIWLVRTDKSFEFWDAAVGRSYGEARSRVFPWRVPTQSDLFVEMFIAAVLPSSSVVTDEGIRRPRRGIHFEGFDPGSE